VSQIEVDSTNEVLSRKKEFFDELDSLKMQTGSYFSALLVTDITTLSSVMFISADSKFESILTFPKRDDHIYFLKDVVSRKKQLIPLLSELVSSYSE
jgi:manganese-dependent inorganic pyrophosphatase